MDTPPRKSGVVIPHKVTGLKRLGMSILSIFARLLMLSWRRRWIFKKQADPLPGPVIFAMWHNRLSVSVWSWNKFAQACWPSTGMCALISASKDGALITDFVERFNVHVVRGSTSRRGPQALLEASGWLAKKYSITITPDGPRGPRYKAKLGTIQLAMITGAAIIPISYYIHSKICLHSWDGFQIPLPFSRCDIHVGEPIFVSREASAEEQARLQAKLERDLMELTKD